ncbi:MAG: 2,4'-dihydroxyacetophenone dioxygenase family protein [Armatimonadota bacterium]
MIPMLADRAIDPEAIPWVPQGDGVWFRPLRFDLSTGTWVNVMRIARGGRINRHRHAGGSVTGYVLSGTWRYLERDWVARAGMFVWEPPGDIHTLVVEEGEEMRTLFQVSGILQYLDDADRVVGHDDVFTKLARYQYWCRTAGIAEIDLCY